MNLLQIYYGGHRLKKFENWLIFGEVMGKSLFGVLFFFDSQCIIVVINFGIVSKQSSKQCIFGIGHLVN